MLRHFVFLIILSTTIPAWSQPPDARRGQQRRDRVPDMLVEGDVAPDFTLKSPDGKGEVSLSDFRGAKPVALVFGSYT